MKILLVFVALTIFSASASTPAVIVEEAQNPTVGSTIPLKIILNGSTNGLSGYNITISLTNTSAAEIVSVDFSNGPLSSKGSLPADSVWLKAVYLNGQTGPGDIVLATVNVRIDAPGTVKLSSNVYLMDDINGNPVFSEKASVKENPTATVTPVTQTTVTPVSQSNAPSVISTIVKTPDTIPAASSTPSVVSTPGKTIQQAINTTKETEEIQNTPKTSGFQVILFITCMFTVFVYRKKYS